MGALWDLIQTELDRERFTVTDRKLALRLGVSPSTIGNWREGINRLPDKKNLRAIADFVGRSYEDVLLVALSETGHAQGTRLADRRGSSTMDEAVAQELTRRGPEVPAAPPSIPQESDSDTA